ncbi:MAG: aminotransferase class I/II-fold pyridoxal phosphate-dependent enzyme [Clostridia bacterium]|nr:aminotransferase class I/II-fold pyridoxal phosphate-dependent enzyme [Clostridia bacterium]
MNEKLSELYRKFDEYKAMNLSLNMARGKPGKEQLDISNDILDPALLGNYKSADGTEVRNYGVLDGIAECKKLYSEILGVPEKNIIVFGNASLTIMYDYIAQCMIFGAGDRPWACQQGIKFLCPVPGYDRHFAILEHFGIEMINIPMDAEGPDMDKVDELIKDEKVKGLICVPMYANPNGISYSERVIERFASLRPAAKDFRVIWDNAYCVHHLSDDCDKFYNIFEYASKYSNEDLFIEVASTSKISFPGAGISVMAASDNNIAAVKKRMTVQTIGYDKINQLRHAAYFRDYDGIKAHMAKHAAIIKPRFDAVLEALEKNFAGREGYSWTVPKGGYFISLDVVPGCAKRTVELCKEAGVTLTGAGATFPYHKDPEDRSIRIAPTFPSLDELKLASEILCLCALIAEEEKNQ